MSRPTRATSSETPAPSRSGQAPALFDAIHPWPLGRYWDDASNDAYRAEGLAPDLELTRSRGQDYFAVVFPGFSWQNLWRNRGEDWPLNLVPRRGGRFLWHQGFNLVDAGATTVYVAMFDEVDEGTAIFKAAETQQDVPRRAASSRWTPTASGFHPTGTCG